MTNGPDRAAFLLFPTFPHFTCDGRIPYVLGAGRHAFPPQAYLILLRDLISTVFEAYLLSSPLTPITKDIVIAAIAAAVSPLTFSSSMGFIGSLAIFSMISILTLVRHDKETSSTIPSHHDE